MKEKLRALMTKIAEHKTEIIKVSAGLVGAAIGVVVAGMIGGSSEPMEIVDYDEPILSSDEVEITEETDEPEEIEE